MTVLALLTLAACGTDSGSGSVSDGGGGAGGDGGGSGGKGSPPPGGGTDVPLSGGTWQVESITTGGEKVPGVPGRTLFSLSAEKGTAGGTACNAYGGMFRFEDGGIVVDEAAHTEIACEDPVMRAERALHEVFHGRIAVRGTESAATLTGAGGGTIALTRTATPRRLPPAPLVGTRWTVVGLASGPEIDAVPPGNGASHLTIGADGTATGRLGCNTFRTTAKADGSSVTFGRLALTRMMCAGEAGKTERALQEVLKGKTAFRLQEGQLSLTAESGKGLTAARTKSA
ncbi:META domain-containing protein [Streptomyces sp. NPDC050504]|uniref:META domain-containing protein n=1 Tax=Streptomyces sp. NPDC050504 TaxID=3365618 RepID=UPI00378CE299